MGQHEPTPDGREVSGMKWMDIGEFKDLGFLQEANRLFFHPRGLALTIQQNKETGEWSLFGVWDCREDPEGIIFAEGDIDVGKVAQVCNEQRRHAEARELLLGGYITQRPTGWPLP